MWPHGWVIQTGSRAQQYGLSGHGQAHGGARATAAWSHMYAKGHGRKRAVTPSREAGIPGRRVLPSASLHFLKVLKGTAHDFS